MAFVYRYEDKVGDTVYVGIVKGDLYKDLNRRVREHARDPRFSGQNFTIKYIAGLPQTDAEFLEAHYVAKTADTNFNTAKKKWGLSSILPIEPDDWAIWEPGLYGTAPEICYTSSTFICPCCGEETLAENRVNIRVEGKSKSSTEMFANRILCQECADRVALLVCCDIEEVEGYFKNKWVGEMRERVLKALELKEVQ